MMKHIVKHAVLMTFLMVVIAIVWRTYFANMPLVQVTAWAIFFSLIIHLLYFFTLKSQPTSLLRLAMCLVVSFFLLNALLFVGLIDAALDLSPSGGDKRLAILRLILTLPYIGMIWQAIIHFALSPREK